MIGMTGLLMTVRGYILTQKRSRVGQLAVAGGLKVFGRLRGAVLKPGVILPLCSTTA